MKKIVFCIMLSGLSLVTARNLAAQVLFPTQPGPGYYESLKKSVEGRIPTAADLTAMTQGTLPEGLTDSLKKYDWFEIASYFYYEKKYRSAFNDLAKEEQLYANVQLNFKRYMENGIVYEMFVNRLKNGDLKVYTTTFDEGTAVKLKEVRMVKNTPRLVTEIFGEEEAQRILSFSNGILVMEISQNPNAPTDKKFRIAYMAVERGF